MMVCLLVVVLDLRLWAFWICEFDCAVLVLLVCLFDCVCCLVLAFIVVCVDCAACGLWCLSYLVVVLLVVLGCFRCVFCGYLVVLFAVDFGCGGVFCLICSFLFMFGLGVVIVLCNCGGCGFVVVCAGCWWWLFGNLLVFVFDCFCGLG